MLVREITNNKFQNTNIECPSGIFKRLRRKEGSWEAMKLGKLKRGKLGSWRTIIYLTSLISHDYLKDLKKIVAIL
jgi:hypothetical protein